MTESRISNFELRIRNEEFAHYLIPQFLIRNSKFLILLCILSLATTAAAQTDPYRPLTRLPTGDWFLSLPSPGIPQRGTWEVKFTHRFNQSIDQGGLSDQIHSLFGLDTNADVLFGV